LVEGDVSAILFFPAGYGDFASLTMISYLNAYFYFIGDDLPDPGRQLCL
jgi:hypothetical protein